MGSNGIRVTHVRRLHQTCGFGKSHLPRSGIVAGATFGAIAMALNTILPMVEALAGGLDFFLTGANLLQ
jgi:hypothetical protein